MGPTRINIGPEHLAWDMGPYKPMAPGLEARATSTKDGAGVGWRGRLSMSRIWKDNPRVEGDGDDDSGNVGRIPQTIQGQHM